MFTHTSMKKQDNHLKIVSEMGMLAEPYKTNELV